MNRTHLEHAVIAVAIQLLLTWPAGPWAAGAIACAIFLGREIAQNEYQALVKHEFSSLNLGTLPWWVGLRYGWSRDSLLDVLVPAIACTAVGVVVGRL